ncbi:MAG TPA: ATP-binding protein, partial [Arenibaculum sp.]|nr:ATP-binding protein [Arenibaculum sp.]
PPAVGDRDRIVQVVLNLLSNAVKFVPERTGTVTLELERADEGLRVCVRDNGPGIAASDLDSVFEKFRQVSDADTGKPAGTGLGLAISRRIVDHLGGRIWVESEPGAGAIFCFTLPAAQPATAGTPSPEAVRTDR